MPATFDLNDNSVVVVIGSGAGGGTVAQQLTARGIKVVCLEAGPRRSLSDIVNNEPEMFVKLSWLDRRIGEGYAPDGMPVWSVKGVGGTTTHWTACCPRLHDFEFRSLSTYGALPDCNLADWPVSLDDMAPWYDRAEDMLGVTGTHGIERLPPSANFKVMEAAARAVGYTDIDTYNMAINSAPRDGRPACLQMGFCNSGCAINAKWTTLFNHITEAEATDFYDLRPQCMVTRIITDDNGRASAVRYIGPDGVEHEQKARVVCVAANVVETTRLLLNSANERFPNGLANSSGSGRPQLHAARNVDRHGGDETRQRNRVSKDAGAQRLLFRQRRPRLSASARPHPDVRDQPRGPDQGRGAFGRDHEASARHALCRNGAAFDGFLVADRGSAGP